MQASSICVAFGGNSPEHEVSVITAIQAMEALKEVGKQIVPLYVSKSGRWYTGSALTDISNYKDLNQLLSTVEPCHFDFSDMGKAELVSSKQRLLGKATRWNLDAVLMAFHGAEGENGAFQGVCETFNLPYTGSNVVGASVAMDKELSKKLCAEAGISVTDSITFYEDEWINQRDSIISRVAEISFPVIVKPVTLGSSIGVKRAEDQQELTEAIETAFRFDTKLIVEDAITPLMEINCSVKGSRTDFMTSVCEMPKGNSDSLTFEDKYLSNDASKGMASADRIIPAPISDELTDEIQIMAGKIFQTLNASGLVRIDFLVNADTNKVYFNEINTIPGSFSFYLWDKSNVSFSDLLLELIDTAFKEHRLKNGRVKSYETNLLNVKSSQGIKGLKGTK